MILTAFTLAFAAPMNHALVDCRARATLQNANGVEDVVGELYTSCLQVTGAVPMSTGVNPWIPEAGSCPSDIDDFATTAADQADSCRHDAVFFDASGAAHVHRREVRTCMAEAGYNKVRPQRAETWLRGCESEAPGDEVAELPARFTIALYPEPDGADNPGVFAVVLDDDGMWFYADGQLEGDAAWPSADPLSVLFLTGILVGWSDADVIAAILYDDAMSVSSLNALEACHPPAAETLIRCSAETPCACPVPNSDGE